MNQSIASILPTQPAIPSFNLYWDLTHNTNKLSALSFFKHIAAGFCVYSPNVEKLYSHFEVVLPKESKEHLIILPDPYTFHDTFNHINEKYLVNTGILLIPGECINKHGIIIAIPKTKKKTYRLLPFRIGSQLVLNRFKEKSQSAFLPILLNPDLRGFHSARPFIHLFRLRLDEIDELSSSEKIEISTSISNKLSHLNKP